ncbi:type III-B CRISPR module-associated Cmr3 family protein [Crassaminicella indica]|uniref:CRISPR-associated protein Cmr3 n=1 Tax=Crassaminicella indica TaxID=2855394 RepID=A0ABX8R8K1_9CLOT|nr:type III-B CRISPR module-associated Cmr3 family protein [Crassaminicella indica]QXM05369.1 CRISPR-associated protein Cmr3 [Crassaminicella indica]
MKSLLKIKPCDNTFFRDGNQFNFDIHEVIRSKNTPYPSVFFGAIFTALLAHNDEFRRAFFKKANYDHEKILALQQVYLWDEKNKKAYIKAPLDLFINENGDVVFGEFKKVDSKLHSLSFECFLQCPEDKNYKRVSNKYINIKNIYDAYAKKQGIRLELKDENEIFIKNYKIGIGINKNTKSIKHGNMYRIEQTEFINNNWSYVVEYEINREYLETNYNGIDFDNLEQGYLKLGGENKVCKFEKHINEKIYKFHKKRLKEINSNKVKILLTSETFFDEDVKDIFKGDLKLLGMVNDKPIHIGGYDMQGKGSARKMYKGYDAGTILLVEGLNKKNVKKEICKKINRNNPKGFNQFVILEGDF